eukprot:SAG22_NODE_7283_length_755_cov_0.974085_2_plen_112_part_01
MSGASSRRLQKLHSALPSAPGRPVHMPAASLGHVAGAACADGAALMADLRARSALPGQPARVRKVPIQAAEEAGVTAAASTPDTRQLFDVARLQGEAQAAASRYGVPQFRQH